MLGGTLGLMQPASVPLVYATWNSSDKNANVTLSNSDRSATNTTTIICAARGTIGKSAGKWYYEVLVNAIPGTALLMIGVGTLAAGIADGKYPGLDAYGWSYENRNYAYHGATSPRIGTGFATGDVIGVAVDMAAGTLKIYKNGVLIATIFSNLSGTVYPMCSFRNSSALTANFGAQAFAYPVPSEYNAGWYN